MRRSLARTIELAALMAATLPILHLAWWSAAVTLPALAVAAVAARTAASAPG